MHVSQVIMGRIFFQQLTQNAPYNLSAEERKYYHLGLNSGAELVA